GDTIITQYISGDPTSVVIDLPQLAPKTYYLVRISNRADFDGEADYMSYFITEDTQMPLALEYTPEDEAWLVNLNEPVRIEFNKPLNTHTVDSGSFFVMGPSGKVPGFINFGSVGDSILLFNPSDPYIPGTRYTVVLTSHIQDNIGNRIDSLSWDFTTGYFKTVDYAGGTITAEGFEVVFPRGAFAAGREIGLGLIPSGRLAYPPEMTFTGLAVDMEGADPSRPGIITFYLPDSTLDLYGPIEWLKIYFYDSDLSSWTYLGGEGSRNELSVALDRLGRYGVFRVEAVDEEAGSYDFASSISLIPRVISPRRGGVNERLSVRFAVSEPTEVLAKIYNTDGRLIKTLIDGSVESVGQQLLEWDGKASDGDFAPDGLYIIVIEAQGKKIQKTFVILNK
ncbi:MAG: Ig-like domain-containing protein, partial [candidate division Zixibacteria bacterium]|nr:Ig-like domain-containing protein [candidate division Zixibacteria bacterium]